MEPTDCDSRPDTEEHILRSIEINTERFKISPQLVSILANTIREMKW